MVRKGSGLSELSDSPRSAWCSVERRSCHREYTVYLNLYQFSVVAIIIFGEGIDVVFQLNLQKANENINLP